MMTVWAGRLTPHARVAVDTSTCRISTKNYIRKLHNHCSNGTAGRDILHYMLGSLETGWGIWEIDWGVWET